MLEQPAHVEIVLHREPRRYLAALGNMADAQIADGGVFLVRYFAAAIPDRTGTAPRKPAMARTVVVFSAPFHPTMLTMFRSGIDIDTRASARLAAVQFDVGQLKHQTERVPRHDARTATLRTISEGILALSGFVIGSNWMAFSERTTAGSIAPIRPEKILRWHRAGFRAYWRWQSRPRSGRLKPPLALRQLIQQMSIDNLLWGAPRTHGELLKHGFDVGQTPVAKYMARRRRPPSQSRGTFLHNHAAGIAALDLFVVPKVGMRLLFALVVVTIDRRLLVAVNGTARPTAAWIARQVTEAFPWNRAPR